MPTIPTDPRARVEAALTAAGQMTPGPLVLRRFVDGTGNDAAAVVHEASGETVATCDNEDRSDEARPVCDAAGIVALRNAVPDLRALLALLDAPAGLTDPTMAVARIEAALTEHGLTSCGDGACIVRLTRATGQQTNGGCQHLRNGLVETRETLQRMAVALRALATLTTEQPAPLTVGAALADPRVQDGSHVVEYSGKHDAAGYRQTRVDAGGGLIWSRWRLADRWGPWRDNGNAALDGCDARKPCRLVPLADADQAPATRGAL